MLAFLGFNEGINQSGLADLLEIEGITLTRILDKLEEKGLVTRRSDPNDRRAWRLHLTHKAHPLIAEMRGIGDRTRAEALASIGDAERSQLLNLLTIMRENLLSACEQPTDKTGPK